MCALHAIRRFLGWYDFLSKASVAEVKEQKKISSVFEIESYYFVFSSFRRPSHPELKICSKIPKEKK